MSVTSFSAFILMALAQAATDRVDADYDDEQWELEYPALIGGFVDQYYSCLKGGSYSIGDGVGFEAQYRLDITRCNELGVRSEKEANAVLARRGRNDATTPRDVARIFAKIRSIHVERGVSLDKATSSRIVASNAYARANSENEGLTPPQCVSAVNGLRDERQAYMETNSSRVKAIYDQAEYSDEDKQAVTSYNAELMRLTQAITLELRACPEANYSLYDTQEPAPED